MSAGGVSGALDAQSAMVNLLNNTLVKAAEQTQQQAMAMVKLDLQAQIDSEKIESIQSVAPIEGLGELLDVLA